MPLIHSALRAAGLLALAAAAALPATEVNRVVLRVNDRIVTLYDYNQRLADRIEQISRSEEPPADKERLRAESPKFVLREFLDENLLLSRANQLEIAPSAEVLANAEQQARRNWGIQDDEQFREALRQTGLTAQDFRNRIRETIMYQEVLDRDVMSQIRVGEDELQRLYREAQEEFRVPVRLHLREVVVLDAGGKPAAEIESLARELRGRLDAGKSLDEIAAEGVASGSTSAAIDLGWLESRELDPALAAAVEGLVAGGFSEPVRARGGWHLAQLVEREEAHVRPFEEVRDALRNRERMKRYQSRLEGYMSDLESKAYIVANAPPEAQGFRRERAQVPVGDPLEQLRTGDAPAPAAPTPAPPAEPPAAVEPPPPPPGAAR